MQVEAVLNEIAYYRSNARMNQSGLKSVKGLGAVVHQFLAGRQIRIGQSKGLEMLGSSR